MYIYTYICIGDTEGSETEAVADTGLRARTPKPVSATASVSLPSVSPHTHTLRSSPGP